MCATADVNFSGSLAGLRGVVGAIPTIHTGCDWPQTEGAAVARQQGQRKGDRLDSRVTSAARAGTGESV
jgi:hypothetical protein